ncbi:MAG TPA: TlpA disulfide reductase family protein [Kofleriaceae bacterium]|nr:TlpA disulfide reductase family protein [Kofleriaceae bacterium]
MSERRAPYLIDLRTLVMVGSAIVVAGAIAALFVWMTPRAAAREVRAACAGLRSNPRNSALGLLPVQAPELVAPDYTGKPFHLSDLHGKVVLLNFWGSWCSVCKSEKPGLATFTDEMAQDGFEVVTVASDVNFDSIKRVLPKGAPYTVLLDQTAEDGEVGAIAHSWGVKAVPESFIIDRDGKIRMYLDNRRDWDGDIARTCIQSIIDE